MIKAIGKNQHLESATVVVHENEPILIDYQSLKIKVSFITQHGVFGSKADASLDNGILHLTFINYNSPSGQSNITPLTIGKMGDKTILLNYAIYSIATGASVYNAFAQTGQVKIFHYTLMLAGE